MQQSIGRKLEPSEHVHHVDGNRLNNDIDNLAVISRKDHTLITKLLICIDESLAETIVRTLKKRFPEIEE